MQADYSLLDYFAMAGPVVKMVMLLLLAASIFSWMLIVQRGYFLYKARKNLQLFESKYWSGIELSKLYTTLQNRVNSLSGIELIFHSGFKNYLRLREQKNLPAAKITDAVQRSMQVTTARETEKLEAQLGVLATIGSVSPYVGLFGTVWGIMTSFQALGTVEQATIAMVAPGISEALLATAMGLFAAIPAVIAYNRYTNQVDTLLNNYMTFQEEFIGMLNRKSYEQQQTSVNTQTIEQESRTDVAPA